MFARETGEKGGRGLILDCRLQIVDLGCEM